MPGKGCSHVGWREGLFVPGSHPYLQLCSLLSSPHSTVGVGSGLESMPQVGQ